MTQKRDLAIEGGTPVRSKEDFLVFGAPNFEAEEIQSVMECYQRRWIGTGHKVAAFEQDFADYKGCKHALALNSCTAALHLSMLACGVGPGDEVITTPMTFCATVNAIIHTGARPVLADCEKDTMNIDPDAIEDKITSRTKALLIVHFAGRCCDMERITSLAKRYDLILIEDCAHAVESEYHGQKAGCFGHLSCFSFYVTKNITTGEGGMVLTDDERFAAKIKTFGLHGLTKDAWSRFSDSGYKHYEVAHAGFKYNMMDTQAALGIHQLRRVEGFWKRRQEIWDIYQKAFADLPCIRPLEPQKNSKHAYHLYTYLVDTDAYDRDWLLDALTAENIGVGVHYRPIHLHPYYKKTFAWKSGEFPNAEWIGERTLSLPLSPALTDSDVQDVCDAVIKVAGSKA